MKGIKKIIIGMAIFFIMTSLSWASPPPATTQISPSGIINQNSPTFIWGQVGSATEYQLWINDANGNIYHEWFTTEKANCNGSICYASMPLKNMMPGYYYWWVRTYNPDGLGPWSNEWTILVTPQPMSVDSTWEDVYDNLPITSGGIMWFGDSISRYCNWSEMLGTPIKNRAIPGQWTAALRDRATKFISCQPSKLFIMIGMCDFSGGGSPADTAVQYGQLLDNIQAASPNTIIYCISVPPVYRTTNPTGISPDANSLIIDFNFRIQTICSQRGLTFIDIHTGMMRDGEAKAEYHYQGDGIHPNHRAYEYIKSIVLPYVQ